MPEFAHTITASMIERLGDCQRAGWGRVYGIARDKAGKPSLQAHGYSEHRVRAATMLGTICHALVERAINGHGSPDPAGMWIAKCKEHTILWDNITPDMEAAIWQTRVIRARMVDWYRDKWGDGKPMAAEVKMSATAAYLTGRDGDANVGLGGTCDLIAPDGSVIDWKTGIFLKQYPPQLALYAWLAERDKGIRPSGKLYHVWMPRNKMDLRSFEYDYEQCLPLLRNIIKTTQDCAGEWAQERAEVPIALHLQRAIPNPSSMLCGKKYCALYNSQYCREGAAAKGEQQ